MLKELRVGDVLVYRGHISRQAGLWYVSSIKGGGVVVFRKTNYGTVITDFLREDDLIYFDILDESKI